MNRIVSIFTASFLAVVLFALPATAQKSAGSPASNSVKIWFRQSKINYDPTLHDNQQNLDSFSPQLDSILSDKIH